MQTKFWAQSTFRMLVVVAATAASPAFAVESHAQQLQKAFVNSCVARGMQRNDSAANAVTFCTCTFDVLARELTLQEYIDLDKAVQDGGNPTHVPALERVRPKLAACKK